MGSCSTYIKITVLMISLVAVVQACWESDPADEGLYTGSEPPIAPNKWKYGETIVTLSDCGKTLTISGNGAMANNNLLRNRRVLPPWYDSRNSITSVIIQESVTSIGDWAFADLENLTSITIPSSVATIGDRAFSGCTGLTSVTIPNSVTSIGRYAFEDCRSLISITIPNSVTTIRDNVFNGCTSLTSIIVQNPTPLPLSVQVNTNAFKSKIINDNSLPLQVDGISSHAFGRFNTNNICLYVPKSSITAYRTADGWNEFKCIRAINHYETIALWIILSILAMAILFVAIFVIIKRSRKITLSTRIP